MGLRTDKAITVVARLLGGLVLTIFIFDPIGHSLGYWTTIDYVVAAIAILAIVASFIPWKRR